MLALMKPSHRYTVICRKHSKREAYISIPFQCETPVQKMHLQHWPAVAAPKNFLWGGGIEGEKCISEGAKIFFKSPEWLIFAIFSFWLGGKWGGRASDGGSKCPLDATTAGLHRDALGQHITHSLSGVKKETLLIPKCECLFLCWFQIWH